MGATITSHDVAAGDEPMAAINVTSLVDVMFCLLIMFMVATPLMSKQAKVELPQAKGLEMTQEELETVMFTVDSKGQVFMGVLPLHTDKEQWVEQISANKKLKEKGVAFLQGDQTVAFDRVLDLMESLKEAGIEEVGFVTDPRTGIAKKGKAAKKGQAS